MAESFRHDRYVNFKKCIKDPNIKHFTEKFVFNKYTFEMSFKKNNYSDVDTPLWGTWIRIRPLQSNLDKNDPLWKQRRVTVLISYDGEISDARFKGKLSAYGYNDNSGLSILEVLRHDKLHKDPNPCVTINVQKLCNCTSKQKQKQKFNRSCEIHHSRYEETKYYGAYPTKKPNTLTQMSSISNNQEYHDDNKNNQNTKKNNKKNTKPNTLTQMFSINNNNKEYHDDSKNNQNAKTKSYLNINGVSKQQKTLTQYFDYE